MTEEYTAPKNADFRLVASDGVGFWVRKQALQAVSTVFADMFEMPGQSSIAIPGEMSKRLIQVNPDNSVDLTESSDVLSISLAVIDPAQPLKSRALEWLKNLHLFWQVVLFAEKYQASRNG
ncbi:hypothetical protein OIV83_004657 [Microbotryomycetes sp. JL201]|nr:hypothetical protein OIV83_004657 [Microbotryomycetes sp. JL201]